MVFCSFLCLKSLVLLPSKPFCATFSNTYNWQSAKNTKTFYTFMQTKNPNGLEVNFLSRRFGQGNGKHGAFSRGNGRDGNRGHGGERRRRLRQEATAAAVRQEAAAMRQEAAATSVQQEAAAAAGQRGLRCGKRRRRLRCGKRWRRRLWAGGFQGSQDGRRHSFQALEIWLRCVFLHSSLHLAYKPFVECQTLGKPDTLRTYIYL